MSVRRALAPPRDLTIPNEGSTTAYDVLSRAVGRAAAEARTIVHARSRGQLGDDAGAVATAVRRPDVGVLVRALRSATGTAAQEIAAKLVALVAIEQAHAKALTRHVRLTRLPARIVASALGVVLDVPSDATEMTFASGRITIDRPAGAIDVDLDALATSTPSCARRAFHEVEPDVLFALEDDNPLAMREAHPDKSGNAVDLGGHSIDEWIAKLRQALAIIRAHLPALHAEVALFRPQIIPVGFDAERHLSASYQEALGTIYLTLHPSLMTMTEAIVHEFSHNKLNALFETDAVLENAFSPLYASPVRPDPRPLHGVLLAVHAFLPIAHLYEHMIAAKHPLAEDRAFRDRFAEIIRINHEGASVLLEHARPTPIGRGVLDEIARWHEHYCRFG